VFLSALAHPLNGVGRFKSMVHSTVRKSIFHVKLEALFLYEMLPVFFVFPFPFDCLHLYGTAKPNASEQ